MEDLLLEIRDILIDSSKEDYLQLLINSIPGMMVALVAIIASLINNKHNKSENEKNRTKEIEENKKNRDQEIILKKLDLMHKDYRMAFEIVTSFKSEIDNFTLVLFNLCLSFEQGYKNEKIFNDCIKLHDNTLKNFGENVNSVSVQLLILNLNGALDEVFNIKSFYEQLSAIFEAKKIDILFDECQTEKLSTKIKSINKKLIHSFTNLVNVISYNYQVKTNI